MSVQNTGVSRLARLFGDNFLLKTQPKLSNISLR
jgi:hypothetical protein